MKDGGDIPVSSSWYYYLPNQILKLVAGYIRPKHTSLTLFINLSQECRLHPSHSMLWHWSKQKIAICLIHWSENALFQWKLVSSHWKLNILMENEKLLIGSNEMFSSSLHTLDGTSGLFIHTFACVKSNERNWPWVRTRKL